MQLCITNLHQYLSIFITSLPYLTKWVYAEQKKVSLKLKQFKAVLGKKKILKSSVKIP
jgi:hypothetical protein